MQQRMAARAWATCMIATTALGVAACGNYINVDVIGASGFSHDAQGNIIAHVQTCEERISELELRANRDGLVAEQHNEVLARYIAPSAQSRHIQVNLSNPTPWTGQPLLDATYPDDRVLLLNPWPDTSDRHGAFGPFGREKTFASSSATKREVLEQPAGTVVAVSAYDGSMQTWTEQEFDAAC